MKKRGLILLAFQGVQQGCKERPLSKIGLRCLKGQSGAAVLQQCFPKDGMAAAMLDQNTPDGRKQHGREIADFELQVCEI